MLQVKGIDMPLSVDKDKGNMDIQLKSMTAVLEPQQDEADDPVGTFHAIISTEKRDRDGDQLWADEWEQPLPEHIQIIGDHDNNHIMSTIGSGPPTLEPDKKIHVRGTYATTTFAQDARKLVNGKHLRTLSVAYREKKGEKGVTRELVNASFVNVPSNTDAVVVESKSHTPNDMPGARKPSGELSDETKSLIQDIVKQTLKSAGVAYIEKDVELFGGGQVVLDRLTQLGLEILVNEKDSTITVKQKDNVLGTHKFSQAPEAPSKEADPPADTAKEKALALARVKTRTFTADEL